MSHTVATLLLALSLCLLLLLLWASSPAHATTLRGHTHPSTFTPDEQEEVAIRATAYTSSVDGTVSVVFGKIDREGGSAFALWYDTLSTVGWGRLHVETNGKRPDREQAYAAGYLEGVLTRDRIWQHYVNMRAATLTNNTLPADVATFLIQQEQWAKAQVIANPNSDMWVQVGLILAQFDGVLAGYNSRSPIEQHVNWAQLSVAAAFGDMFDIKSKFSRPDFHAMSKEELHRYVNYNSHCTGIVRVTDDFSNLFSGHTSWFDYQVMNRIYKVYTMNFSNKATAARSIAMSSYPGTLASNDDFYITDQRLNIIETTNAVLNATLFDYVTSSALLTWQRAILASRMATSGEEWTGVFSQHNSGTYNNQFFVVDYKKFTPGKYLPTGTLWVLEQIPGMIMAQDRTLDLNYGFWPSYNVAAIRQIYNISGYPEFREKYGNHYSYLMAPRAILFRNRANQANDVDGMKYFMRYNEFETDPLADLDAGAAIAARFDLSIDAKQRGPYGGYDSKFTSYGYIANMSSWIINGPTTQNQPAFSFTGPYAQLSHEGLPTTFDFDWMLAQPEPVA